MDIQTRKIEFVQEFLKLQNEELIILLEKLLKSESLKKNDDFQNMSVEELNKRIDQSLDDSKNNRLTKAGDLMTEIEKWK